MRQVPRSKTGFKAYIPAVLLFAAAVTACGDGGSDQAPRITDIRTLSNRADFISGGDALTEVTFAASIAPERVKVYLNGSDITAAFTRRPDGRLLGIVQGLQVGKNEVSARVVDGGTEGPLTTLNVINHPIGGPIFSGPQIQPWVCETDKVGLGPAIDAQCNAKTVVDWLYKSTDPSKTSLQPYDPDKPPSDIADTATESGATVKFIVRRETGTMNRGIYALAVVADPAKSLSPLSPPAGWNGALHYHLAGGALPQQRQGPINVATLENPRNLALDIPQLAKGYASAASTLTVFGQQMNSVVAAETISMIKEKVVEQLGEIKFTIADGSSGASIQMNQIVNAYPGLLDGITPSLTIPDVWSSNVEVQDCSLLARYFDTTSPAMWHDVTQQNAVWQNADLTPGTCRAWVNTNHLDVALMNPASTSCFYAPGTGTLSAPSSNPILAWFYNALTNVTGSRCTLQDYQRNLFGLRPDGFAERPYDNVGVQYGLVALRAGKITPEQFVDLNEKVGGRDIDWNWQAQRVAASSVALARLYRTGQYNLLNNSNATPIIDNKACINSEIHSCFNSFKLRERLRESTGSVSSHVLMLNKPSSDLSNLDMLARWVRAIKADTSSDAMAVKVQRAKPADAVDMCWINNQKVTDFNACLAANPYYGDSRTGAGSAITVSNAKCQLVPMDRTSYTVNFTDPQWARLQASFPDGVCDWTKPGVGKSAVVPWLTFDAVPGGQEMPLPPTAH